MYLIFCISFCTFFSDNFIICIYPYTFYSIQNIITIKKWHKSLNLCCHSILILPLVSGWKIPIYIWYIISKCVDAFTKLAALIQDNLSIGKWFIKLFLLSYTSQTIAWNTIKIYSKRQNWQRTVIWSNRTIGIAYIKKVTQLELDNRQLTWHLLFPLGICYLVCKFVGVVEQM